jgi:hypothetical protein
MDDPQLDTFSKAKRACRPMCGTSASMRISAKGAQGLHHLAMSIVPA